MWRSAEITLSSAKVSWSSSSSSRLSYVASTIKSTTTVSVRWQSVGYWRPLLNNSEIPRDLPLTDPCTTFTDAQLHGVWSFVFLKRTYISASGCARSSDVYARACKPDVCVYVDPCNAGDLSSSSSSSPSSSFSSGAVRVYVRRACVTCARAQVVSCECTCFVVRVYVLVEDVMRWSLYVLPCVHVVCVSELAVRARAYPYRWVYYKVYAS